MSTINRFNKFTPRSYEWSTYIPQNLNIDFSAFDALLAKQQSGYDTAIAASQKYPSYLDTREELAGQYKAKVDQGIQDITSAYANNSIQEGNRKLRDYGLALNRDWQPGGLAYELNQEHAEYQGAAAQIDKYYKDNKAENSANRTRSLSNLQDAKKNPFTYNDKTGLYTRQGISPSIYPYVDIQEEAQKAIKEIKEQGHTDIIPMGAAWFRKIQTEEVTPETIKAVATQLLQQPKYSGQVETELWAAKQNYSPEQLANITQAKQQQVLSQFDDQVSKLDNVINSKSSKDIKQIQRTLADEGYYDGSIDGQAGKATKEAYERYKEARKQDVVKKAANISPDAIIKQEMLNNYIDPLVKTYAYKKVEQDLIFNQEWGVNRKIAAGKAQTSALIGAIQSLKDVPQSNTLVSPGAARPMEALDDIRNKHSQAYEASKQTFDQVVQFSGIGDMIGSTTPATVHTVTNARLQSKTPGEFEQRLHDAGITGANAGQLWNFYNSPAADQLKGSYSTMSQAKSNMDNIDMAKTSVVANYFKTPEGRTELARVRKQHNLNTASDDDIAKMVSTNDPKLRTTYNAPTGVMAVRAGANYANNGNTTYNDAQIIQDKLNAAAKTNPELFPESLRGYSINSIKGAGADLEKVIVDDIRTGNTLGYHSEGQAGVVFKDASGSKVDNEDVDASKAQIRFNVDAKGVTYYLTAPSADGKSTVTAAIEAPTAEHGNRLRQMSLQMKKEAETTGDASLAAQAEQLYVLTTKGERTSRAVEDAIQVTDRNSRQLYDIIDPTRSAPGRIATFANNENMKGLPVGEPIEANGLVYQKFKVKNPKTGKTSYMTTYKTDTGSYIPINNKTGGFYFGTSSEAESPIWSAEMINQIPVQVNQQKVKENTISEDEMNALLLTVPGALNQDNE